MKQHFTNYKFTSSKLLKLKSFCRRKGKYLFLFAAAFIAGEFIGYVAGHLPFQAQSSENSATNTETSGQITNASSGSWGLSFPQEGQLPTATANIDELKKFNSYFAEKTDEKIIYLTFDCGYENGNTPKILDALKKHNVPATFFCVGNFLKDNPDLIKRMKAEGHIVGNHTFTHPDMSKISTMDTFQAELTKVEDLYKEITGEEMTKFYRPPQGQYSEQNLEMAKSLGYQTFFWSLAYVDWYQDKQPTKEEAFSKLLKRIHPGAVVLLHNTSSTNGEILDELLSKWEEMGYTFKPLGELPGRVNASSKPKG